MEQKPNKTYNYDLEDEFLYIDPSDHIDTKPKTYDSMIEYILSKGFPSLGTIIQFFFIPFPGVNSAFTGDIKLWLFSLYLLGRLGINFQNSYYYTNDSCDISDIFANNLDNFWINWNRFATR